jgi:outer membrane biosynthesis protein TonB
MLKHTHSHSCTCACPMHHHKLMSPRKEVKIVEHFTNNRIGEGSREKFIKLVEEEIKCGAPIEHLKYKLEFLDHHDPAQKKIILSEKKAVDQGFVKYLLSDSSPRNVKYFLHPEGQDWIVSKLQEGKAKETKKKPKAAKKTAKKTVKPKKIAKAKPVAKTKPTAKTKAAKAPAKTTQKRKAVKTKKVK